MTYVDENTSDGYHTFRELYRHRALLTAAWLNTLMELDSSLSFHDMHASDEITDMRIHKSRLHHDGTMFGDDWFIVMATLPTGQISYHYPMTDWDLFDIPEHERADAWDGHTSEQVTDRIAAYLVLNATHEEYR